MKDPNKIDLSHLDKYLTNGVRKEFYLDGGKEHYRLLNILAEGLDLVYDIGTHKGASAVALSSALKVKTFDIQNQIECTLPNNVEYSEDNYLTKDILKSDLILIDIDHTGKTEKKILDYLVKNKYYGIVVFDDIYYSPAMTKFWKSIKHKKQDLTHLGHYTGTGVVFL